jgi:hypothetical protein
MICTNIASKKHRIHFYLCTSIKYGYMGYFPFGKKENQAWLYNILRSLPATTTIWHHTKLHVILNILILEIEKKNMVDLSPA